MCPHCLQPFNGAATFSLRKAPMNLHTNSSQRHLQWGRNFFVAESSPSRHAYEGGIITFNGAATFSLRKGAGHRPSSPCIRPFNGAATFSLRKVGTGPHIAGDGVPLQWGRNFFVAERMTGMMVVNATSAAFNGAATFSLRKAD